MLARVLARTVHTQNTFTVKPWKKEEGMPTAPPLNSRCTACGAFWRLPSLVFVFSPFGLFLPARVNHHDVQVGRKGKTGQRQLAWRTCMADTTQTCVRAFRARIWHTYHSWPWGSRVLRQRKETGVSSATFCNGLDFIWFPKKINMRSVLVVCCFVFEVFLV